MSRVERYVQGDVLPAAGQVYGARAPHGRTRYIRVIRVNRPVGELPFVTAAEVHPSTYERWGGLRGETFVVALTWAGRSWNMPSWYVQEAV